MTVWRNNGAGGLRFLNRPIRGDSAMKSLKTKVAICVLAGFLVATGFAILSGPDGVVVGVDGEVIGLTNKTREALQGERFWVGQLITAKRQLRWLEERPARDAEHDAKLTEFTEKANQKMEAFKRDRPDFERVTKPSEGDALRALADDADRAESKARMEGMRIKRMADGWRQLRCLPAPRKRWLSLLPIQSGWGWPVARRPSAWCCTPGRRICAATFTCMR